MSKATAGRKPQASSEKVRGDDLAVMQLSRPPERLVMWRAPGHPISLDGLYAGGSCFLILSGISNEGVDFTQFQKRGIVTMGVNNSWSLHRPNLWVCNDTPGRFLDQGWRDPGILKFCPARHLTDRIHNRHDNGQFVWTNDRVWAMPNTLFYIRNQSFDAGRFLVENTINFGNTPSDRNPSRHGKTVFLAALKILFYLGFGRVYLVGADFHMPSGHGKKYAFVDGRETHMESVVRNNTKLYNVLNTFLAELKPHLDRSNIEIVNCTPNSKLTVFPYTPLSEAIQREANPCSQAINTDGWYDASRNTLP